MSGIDQITYRARGGSDGMVIVQTETSIRDQQQADTWQRRLDLWLRRGSPLGCAYLDFGSQAAFIRWQASDRSRLGWEYAFVLAGLSASLTGTYALELAEHEASQVARRAGGMAGARQGELRDRARSAAAISTLIPVLAHALQRERRVTMPWASPELPDAVMWGLISILRMIGDDRPVSFLTYVPAPSRDGDTPGLLVSFRPDATALLRPDEGFATVAADLAHRFADDPAELRRTLIEHGVPEAADHNARISRLLGLPSGARRRTGNVDREETTTVRAATSVLMCPICLAEIPDWDALGYWRYGNDGDYEEIRIPPDVNPTQRARYLHGAYVRCPSAQAETMAVHYLPARYGNFGDPVLLGFVGLTESGKTHLLASMIGGMGKLSDYRVDVQPLDPAMHQRFLENSVRPLITRNEALPGTPDDATTQIADAFIIRHGNGPERVVALFDVSGGVLAQANTDKTREFLWIADGLFFVIDPDHIKNSKAGTPRSATSSTSCGPGPSQSRSARPSSSTRRTRRASRNRWHAGCARETGRRTLRSSSGRAPMSTLTWKSMRRPC